MERCALLRLGQNPDKKSVLILAASLGTLDTLHVRSKPGTKQISRNMTLMFGKKRDVWIKCTYQYGKPSGMRGGAVTRLQNCSSNRLGKHEEASGVVFAPNYHRERSNEEWQHARPLRESSLANHELTSLSDVIICRWRSIVD